jgi:hypothetical protein
VEKEAKQEQQKIMERQGQNEQTSLPLSRMIVELIQ